MIRQSFLNIAESLKMKFRRNANPKYQCNIFHFSIIKIMRIDEIIKLTRIMSISNAGKL